MTHRWSKKSTEDKQTHAHEEETRPNANILPPREGRRLAKQKSGAPLCEKGMVLRPLSVWMHAVLLIPFETRNSQ